MVLNKKQIEYMLDIIKLFSDKSVPHYHVGKEQNFPQAILPKSGQKTICMYDFIF
jgi:hypothetical protein